VRSSEGSAGERAMGVRDIDMSSALYRGIVCWSY
jgi:hypothetical protein